MNRNEKVDIFLKSCKANLKIESCYSNVHTDGEFTYRYVIIRNGKQLSGRYSARSGEKPTAYDILKDLPVYEPEVDLWAFAKMHGYQISCQQDYDLVLSIYKEYCHNWRGVNKVFGDVLDELWEIL